MMPIRHSTDFNYIALNRMAKTRKNVAACVKRVCPYAAKQMEKQKRDVLKNIKNKNEKAFLGAFVKSLKYTDEMCAKEYCNPGCKATIYEPGKNLSKNYIKGMKFPMLANTVKKIRKGIFGKKTNVLVNDFYEGLPAANVKKYKNHGAISGCTRPEKKV